MQGEVNLAADPAALAGVTCSVCLSRPVQVGCSWCLRSFEAQAHMNDLKACNCSFNVGESACLAGSAEPAPSLNLSRNRSAANGRGSLGFLQGAARIWYHSGHALAFHFFKTFRIHVAKAVLTEQVTKWALKRSRWSYTGLPKPSMTVAWWLPYIGTAWVWGTLGGGGGGGGSAPGWAWLHMSMVKI